MFDFRRGQKESIRKLCGGLTLELELYHKAPVEVDISCFGLDAAGRLSDEQYFIFYNQKQSPEGAINLGQGAATGSILFRLELDRLPEKIAKLSFTASIDGTRTMRELSKGQARILTGNREQGRFEYDGSAFSAERAIVICELYRRGDDWRFSAVGRGFNGGLKALVENFGGTVAAAQGSPAPGNPLHTGYPDPLAGSITSRATGPAQGQANLESLPAGVRTRMDDIIRQCRGDTEYLIPLYRNMFSSLSRYPGIANQDFDVVMCADASGSMYDMYRNGRIQRVVDKFFAYTTTISEGGNMDFWAFGAKSRQFGAVTMYNVRDYTFSESGGFERWMSLLNYQYNNEPEAMRDLMMVYGGIRKPTVVLFLTDGRLTSDWEVEEILVKTSRFPIYWQFIGLHGEQYGVLENLDQIDGRFTANAAFLKLDDIDCITDNELYEQLLRGTNSWLAEIAEKKLLEP